ncbi:MFS general substrate transporter [Aulographum hederae CBS 113979]|uniref:MFS general substrate transporter n=1 Tax=Aulographum hederae CBS 113979 TaxID=1176131 RepID=A0A6G1GMN8_9PEZI|nr:MFS general substrate transporter [Aulographum hederae CBS 113979]
MEDPDDGDDEEKSFLPDRSQGARDITDDYTPEDDRQVLRKLDRRLVLFMALLYMMSFLDRSNIGNARVAGMMQDLHLSASQYEWLLTAFYINYILFEWMTLLYRVFPPHVYISICVLSWGVLASLQSIATSFVPLLILRALLGVGEAAFGPGVPFYLSFFFRRNELAMRTGLFISAAPLATSFASTLAWVLMKVGQGGPVAPWRLLFLVEGFPSVFVAVFAWHFIPDDPSTAKFLSPRERKVAAWRVAVERDRDAKPSQGQTGSGVSRGLNVKQVLQTLADPKCYLTALMFFSCNVAFSSLPVFLPTIIKEIGYESLTAQALSAPPYLVSFLVVLLTSHISDRLQSRSPLLIMHALSAAFGYALIALAGSLRWPPFWRYIGIYPACAGFFSAITLIITWTINNQESESGRGTGMAILNVVGQCGPLLGTRLYPDTDAPYYVRGMSVCAVFMVLVAVLAMGLRFMLSRENARRAKEKGSAGNGEDAVPLFGRGERRQETFLYFL